MYICIMYVYMRAYVFNKHVYRLVEKWKWKIFDPAEKHNRIVCCEARNNAALPLTETNDYVCLYAAKYVSWNNIWPAPAFQDE